MITYSDLLLLYARRGLLEPLRKSAFRKFCRRNRGNSHVTRTKRGFAIKTTLGDSVDNSIYVYGTYEEGTTHVIASLASECDCFVDVGCNIGYYSCLFGSMNPDKHLIAIDPNPAMIQRTQESLKLNDIVHYQLLTCGVGAEPGNLTLHISDLRHSLSSFAYAPKSGHDQMTVVEIKPLRDILAQRQTRKALVKIDTEGFEYEVFSGLSNHTIHKIKFIVFELSALNLRRAGIDPKKLLSLPFMKDFDIYRINEEDEGSIAKDELEYLVGNDQTSSNVLLVGKDAESKESLRRTGIRHR